MASATITNMTCNIRLDNGTKGGKMLVRSQSIGPALDFSAATDDRLYAVAMKVKNLYANDLIDIVKTVKSTLSA